MKAIVSVIGRDKIGIISRVSGVLSQRKINILDISQTILDQYFTMIMLVDLDRMEISFAHLTDEMNRVGEELGLSIKVQHQEIFDAMHKLDKE